MATMPTNEEITEQVLITIKVWSGRPISMLDTKHEIGTDLNITGPMFRTFTGSLRMYIQRFNEKETLTVPELGKAKTVGAVVILVIKKITGTTIDDAMAAALVAAIKEEWV